MRIFGHRGAAGLALENSRESILAGLAQPVELVEFDIHMTSDGHLIVMHDHITGRVATRNVNIHTTTLAELQAIPLKNGQHIMTLDEVFELVGDTKPVMLDIKDSGCADEIVATLDRHPVVRATITSYKHDNIRRMHELRPDIETYPLEHFSPFEIVAHAHAMGATGVSLNVWLLNPLTYRLCKRYELDLIVYTVNHPWLARFLHWLYPGIGMYTDHPERFAAFTHADGTTTKRP